MHLHWHSRQSVEAQTVLIDAGQPPFPILVDRKNGKQDATQLRFWQVEFGTYWGAVGDLRADLLAQRLENDNNLPVQYLNDLVDELQPLVDKLAEAIADEQDSRRDPPTLRNIRRSAARERQQWYLFAILIQVFSLPREYMSFLDRAARPGDAATTENGQSADEAMQDWRRCQIYLCCHVEEDRRRVPAVDRVRECSARLSPLIGDACLETRRQSDRRVQEIANAFRA
jgi:hypothetical protein